MSKSIIVAIMDYISLHKKDLLTRVILMDLIEYVDDRYLFDTVKIISNDFDLTLDIENSKNIKNSEKFFIMHHDKIFNLINNYIITYDEVPIKEFNTENLVKFAYIYTIFLLNVYLENQTLIEEV